MALGTIYGFFRDANCAHAPGFYLCGMRKIKLVWDFRGPASAKTAAHHEIHLKEFIAMEKLPLNITGFQVFNEMYAIAFMVVTDEDMILVRDALKPHRGEIYEG
jgi:hypothetical protein